MSGCIPAAITQTIDSPQYTSVTLEKELLSNPIYSQKSEDEWESQIEYRDIDHLPDDRLDELVEYYPAKINRLNDSGYDVSDEDIARLEDKFICVLKEIELRESGIDREIHHTTYYIDLDAGNDGDTGLDTGHAWLTLGKYTTVTVRSAGDIAYVRANTDEDLSASSPGCDEDGTIALPIQVIGCNSTIDPWSDGSDVKPLWDFGGTTNRINTGSDLNWEFHNLAFTNSTYTNGMIYLTGENWLIENCDFSDGNTAAISTGDSQGVIIKDCTITNMNNYGISTGTGFVKIINCMIDSGAAVTNYAVYNVYGIIYVENCLFGTVVPMSGADIFFGPGSCIYMKNCLCASGTEVTYAVSSSYCYYWSFTHSEDHDQVKGSHKSWYYLGTVENDSAVQIDGYDSILMKPSSYLLESPNEIGLTIANDYSRGDYQIWCPANIATTITIKAKETAAWGTDPTASQFYFTANYYDQAAPSAHRTSVTSAQALNGINEVSFTMTFTPLQDGWVYVYCYLKKYEAGKSVNISIQPTIS